MRKLIKSTLFERSALFNGLLALSVIAAVALGCTCNEKDGFNFGLNSNSPATEQTDAADDGRKDTVETAEKADASKGEIPSEVEMQELVKATLLDFDDALKKEDFADFHSNISETWKKQVSPRQLKKMFQSFIDGKADISSIRSMDANFESGPKLNDESGLEFLEVKGNYPTSPNPTSFELKYLADGDEWKLGAIFVRTTLYP